MPIWLRKNVKDINKSVNVNVNVCVCNGKHLNNNKQIKIIEHTKTKKN